MLSPFAERGDCFQLTERAVPLSDTRHKMDTSDARAPCRDPFMAFRHFGMRYASRSMNVGERIGPFRIESDLMRRHSVAGFPLRRFCVIFNHCQVVASEVFLLLFIWPRGTDQQLTRLFTDFMAQDMPDVLLRQFTSVAPKVV